MSRLAHYPVVYKSFFNFRDFLHPGTVFGVEHESTTPGPRLENLFSSRGARAKFSIALQIQCTARPALLSDFIPFDRANQELNNAFLDESLAQTQAEI